ncbi:hypothetical protein AAZX31_08G318900 [Glycine max]
MSLCSLISDLQWSSSWKARSTINLRFPHCGESDKTQVAAKVIVGAIFMVC